MNRNLTKNISECQIALNSKGFFITPIELPASLLKYVKTDNFCEIDNLFKELTSPNGELFEYLKLFCSVKSIEFILSIRESRNDWEEDGIWHDDGSRILAFSLSLTVDPPQGGVLEIRRKGQILSEKIVTPSYGNIIVFKTGIDNFEHKINRVTKGRRFIIAGWCYDETEPNFSWV